MPGCMGSCVLAPSCPPRAHPTMEMFMSRAEVIACASPVTMAPVIAVDPDAASAEMDMMLMVVPIMVCGLENL